MPLQSFILSPEVEVAILALYKDERDEYEDVFTIVRKRKAELWKMRWVKNRSYGTPTES